MRNLLTLFICVNVEIEKCYLFQRRNTTGSYYIHVVAY